MSEPYVSTEEAAAHLAVTPRRLLDLARGGVIPGYPASLGSTRYQWRFKISEVDAAMELTRANFTFHPRARIKRPKAVPGIVPRTKGR